MSGSAFPKGRLQVTKSHPHSEFGRIACWGNELHDSRSQTFLEEWQQIKAARKLYLFARIFDDFWHRQIVMLTKVVCT